MIFFYILNQITEKHPAITRLIMMAIWILLFSLLATATQAQCRGNFQKLMTAGDSLVIPCDDMILMNMNTFESYYLAEKNLEALKAQLPKYKQIRDSLQAELDANSKDYKTIIQNQQQMLQLENMSKEDALQTAIHLEADLLGEKKKVKRWQMVAGGAGLYILISILIGLN